MKRVLLRLWLSVVIVSTVLGFLLMPFALAEIVPIGVYLTAFLPLVLSGLVLVLSGVGWLIWKIWTKPPPW